MEARNYGLDVVRCTAILMVLFMHTISSLYRIPIPYLWYVQPAGVELFFSLSGFLIGRIIVKSYENNGINLTSNKEFWIRRWFRTLPAYFIVYLILVIFYNLWGSPVAFDARYLLFVQNIHRSNGFFSESWSLCIEEWCYLLAPVIAFAWYQSAKLLKKRITPETTVFLTAITMIIFSNIARLRMEDKTEYVSGTAYRLDAIAYGFLAALCSLTIRIAGNVKAALLVAAGVATWLVAAVFYMSPAITGAAKFIYYPVCGAGTSMIVLGMYFFKFKKSFRWVTFISRISYSIYLLNSTAVLIPLMDYVEPGPRLPVLFIGMASVAFIIFISWLSWKYIEQPFLRIRNRIAPA